MTAFAAVTLHDHAAVAKVFSPQSIDSAGVATLMTSDALLDAKSRLTVSVALPKNGGSVSRIKMKVLKPIMNSVDTSKKDADAYLTIEAVCPKICSSNDRLDLLAFAKDLLDDALTTAAFTNLEALY